MSVGSDVARFWWTVPAIGLMLLVTFAMVGGGERDIPPLRTSHDPTNRGTRAAYLMLEELGYPVSRSRRPADGAIRWVIWPNVEQSDLPSLRAWIENGGLLVLFDFNTTFAAELGLSSVRAEEPPSGWTGSVPIDGVRDVGRLSVGDVQLVTSAPDGGWGDGPDDSVSVQMIPMGRGEVWVVRWPDVIINERIRQADNPVWVCRLAEASLERRPDSEILFDEYVHGMRERPGVIELLARPPMLWVSLHGLLLTVLVIWHRAPRFGPLRSLPPTRRRSREEFLDAMAHLLERKGDFPDAYRTVRDQLAKEIRAELHLPASVPMVRLADEIGHRREIDPARLIHLFSEATADHIRSPSALTQALNDLESLRDDYFRRRSAGSTL